MCIDNFIAKNRVDTTYSSWNQGYRALGKNFVPTPVEAVHDVVLP